jgi:hypothetical protein
MATTIEESLGQKSATVIRVTPGVLLDYKRVVPLSSTASYV